MEYAFNITLNPKINLIFAFTIVSIITVLFLKWVK